MVENQTRTKRFVLPSGYYVVIREQNGEDDNILSNPTLQKNLEHHTNFIAGIIVDTDLPMAVKGRITAENAKEILLNDKYTILFQSRIFSIGDEIQFPYVWTLSDGKKDKVMYSDTLSDYVWDFETPAPLEGKEGYNQYRVKPYAAEAYNKVLLYLASGKEVRFHLLNTNSERTLANAIIDGTYSRTKDLISRGLEIKINEEWMLVENFAMFNKIDMTELYRLTELVDPTFLGISELLHEPTGTVNTINLITLTDFFFPEGI